MHETCICMYLHMQSFILWYLGSQFLCMYIRHTYSIPSLGTRQFCEFTYVTRKQKFLIKTFRLQYNTRYCTKEVYKIARNNFNFHYINYELTFFFLGLLGLLKSSWSMATLLLSCWLRNSRLSFSWTYFLRLRVFSLVDSCGNNNEHTHSAESARVTTIYIYICAYSDTHS